MRVKSFNHVRFPGDWELNFIGQRWNLRVGRSQIALWHYYEPIFMWLAKPFRPGKEVGA